MSQDNPTPEERQKIVEGIMKGIRETTPETELEEIRRKRDEIRNRVIAQMRPLVQAAVEAPPISPQHAHSALGRSMLLSTAAKLYMDALRSINREEAITLLAFEYGNLTVEYLL